MITNTLFISGFKCFDHSTFKLSALTALTGNNGTGKSSVIQALLLIRLAIEKNLQDSDSLEYTGKNWKGYHTPLNNGYELSLGTVNDIFNDKSEKINKIKIHLDEDKFEIFPPVNEEENHSIKVSLITTKIYENGIPFWRRKEFYYLNAERLGPRFGLTSNYTDYLHCGFKGEYVAQVILSNSFLKVDEKRLFKNSSSKNLSQQIDAWLDYICPGTSVVAEPLSTMSAQIRLRNSSSKKDKLAPNMGYGISYALPIIVTGLISQRDSVFIVENPEAHLHPKGQSNIGFFLGKVASSGVKVIIETHSEHVVNGIRKAVIAKELNTSDVSIYFFNDFDKKGKRIIPINIEPNGDLSDFPLDFFDQARQDLNEILKLSQR